MKIIYPSASVDKKGGVQRLPPRPLRVKITIISSLPLLMNEQIDQQIRSILASKMDNKFSLYPCILYPFVVTPAYAPNCR